MCMKTFICSSGEIVFPQYGDGWIKGEYTWIIRKQIPRDVFLHKVYGAIFPMSIT